MKRKSNGSSSGKVHIDKNIPLPERKHGRPRVYAALSKLRKGYSIGMSQFNVKRIEAFRTGVYGYCKSKHPKWRMSVMQSDRAKDGGARVWRVK